jgi:hypothetical protein
MVGNKTDLDRKVSAEMAEQKATELKLTYYEVSAKTGDFISQLFMGISQSFAGADFQLQPPPNAVGHETVTLETPNTQKDSKCCGG